ncbi:hypothetical protein [Streptomyces sp. NPDC051135]|uniref:hypothetical protein n=1 Tax=unclassified Streptomyces TaxID=2593676 RepID=UPI003420015D
MIRVTAFEATPPRFVRSGTLPKRRSRHLQVCRQVKAKAFPIGEAAVKAFPVGVVSG